MDIKQHAEVIAEEIEYVTLPASAVPRLKRKTIVEYLTNRLESLERESNKFQEAEAFILKASRDKLFKHASENPIKSIQDKKNTKTTSDTTDSTLP